MALGDSRTSRLSVLFAQKSTQVTVKRFQAATDPSQESIWATPTNPTATTFTADIIIGEENDNLIATLAGGKPVSVLSFAVQAGLLQSSDEFDFGGHTYKVSTVKPVQFDGSTLMEACEANRVVT